MTALESLQTRLKNFKVNYTYDPLFSYEENRGSFVIQRLNMQVGYYAEEVMPEWDPDPESKHLGAGKKTDWENSTCVFELKRNPKANNGSSKKGDVPKLAKDADLKGFRKGKVPISVLKSKYYSSCQYEALTDRINENYVQALIQQKINPVNKPEIKIVKIYC